jgi:hypothetical protein
MMLPGCAGILPALRQHNFWKSLFHLCKSVADRFR